MKKILLVVALVLGLVSKAHADNISDLMGLGVPGAAAAEIDAQYSSAITSDVNISTTGKTVAIQEATSASACSGTLTFNGTTAVVTSTTCATTGSRIFLTPTSDPTGSTAAYCWVSAISNGVSFSVDCDQANDSTANWIIFHEAN